MEKNTWTGKNSVAAKPRFDADEIFKYTDSVEQTLRDLTLGYSKLNTLNDPFETSFRIRYHGNYDASTVAHAAAIDEQLKEHIARQHSTSFSASPGIALMWAHYADKHRGVCLCFNRREIFPRDGVRWRSGYVTYSSEAPAISVTAATTVDQISSLADQAVLTKSADWSYEKEYRIYGDADIPAMTFVPSSLKCVIIGAKTSESGVSRVEELVSKYNADRSLDVHIAHATVGAGGGWREVHVNNRRGGGQGRQTSFISNQY